MTYMQYIAAVRTLYSRSRVLSLVRARQPPPKNYFK